MIESVFDEAMAIVNSQPKEKGLSTKEIIDKTMDSMTIAEKVKLISKHHKQTHNLTMYYKNNVNSLKLGRLRY